MTFSQATRTPLGTPSGPALAQLGDTLFMARRRERTDTLVIATWSAAHGWVESVDLGGQVRAAPSMAVLHDRLYVMWWGGEPDPAWFFYRWYDAAARRWHDQERFPVKLELGDDGPAIAAYAGRLYLAWRNQRDDHPYYAFLQPGTGWSAPVALEDWKITGRPGLAVHRDRLYLAARGRDSERDRVFTSSCDGQHRWSKLQAHPLFTKVSPALADFGGALHMLGVTPTTDAAWSATMTVTDGPWTQAIAAPTVATRDDAALAVHHVGQVTTLVAGWKAVDQTFASAHLQGAAVVDAKFMTGFELASPVAGGAALTAVTGASGEVELFSIATDGRVMNVAPDPKSDTGWRADPLGLTGRTIAVARTGAGRLIVFAANDRTVAFVEEQAAPRPRWSAPRSAPVAAAPIAGLAAASLDGSLVLATLVRDPARPDHLEVWRSAWNSATPSLGTKQGFGVASTAIGLAVAARVPTLYEFSSKLHTYRFDGQGGPGTAIDFPPGLTAIEGAALIDGAGNPSFVALLSDRAVYHRAGTGAWHRLTGDLTLARIVAQADARGRLEVLALHLKDGVYHLQQDDAGAWSAPLVLEDQAAVIAAARDAGDDTHAFVVGTGPARPLVHLVRGAASTGWNREQVEVQPGGAVTELVTCAMDVTLVDAAGQPRAGARFLLWPDEAARVAVGGAVHWLDARRPLEVETDRAGRLHVAIATSKLSVPMIHLRPLGPLADDPYLLMPNADVEHRLRRLTAEQVEDARDAHGEHLIKGPNRKRDCEVVASTTRMALGLAPTMMHAPAPPRRGAGVRYTSLPGTTDVIDPARVPPQAWIVKLGEAPSFTEISPAEALTQIEALEALMATGDRKSLAAAWGDFWRSVQQGVSKVTSVIVMAVKDAVKVVVEFASKTFQYVYQATVRLFQQVFDLVEGVFKELAAKFQQLFEWLGSLFDWRNILRTHEAVVHGLDQTIAMVGLSAGALKDLILGGLHDFQTTVSTYFDDQIRKLELAKPLGAMAEGKDVATPDLDAAASNNPFMTGMMAARTGTSTRAYAAPALSLETRARLGEVWTTLYALGEQTRTASPFNEAADYVKRIGDDPGAALQLAWAALLKLFEGIATALIGAAHDAIAAMFEAVVAVIEAIRGFLDAPWHLPLIGDLYTWAQRQAGLDPKPLTAMRFFAMLIATPATPLQRALFKDPPFPDDAALAAFKQHVTAEHLYQWSGIGRAADPQLADGAARARAALRGTGLGTTLSIAYSVNYGIYGFLEAYTDLDFSEPSPDELADEVSVTTLMSEWLSQFLSVPWLLDEHAPPARCSRRAAEFEGVVWFYQFLGPIIDTVAMVWINGLAKNGPAAGAALDTLYGVVHAGFVVTLIVFDARDQRTDVLKNIQNLCGLLSEVFKFLRIEFVRNATRDASGYALALIDVYGDGLVAGINFVRTVAPPKAD